MTGNEWLNGTDPAPMLEYWRYRGRDRELRLIVCAACSRGRSAIEDETFLRALEDESISQWSLADTFGWHGVDSVLELLREIADSSRHNLKEEAAQATLIRDSFGNPFQPISLDPTWLTSTVVALAQAAYDNRVLPVGTLEPDRLSILADALEDAGCTDAAMLEHLRGPGPHVRGCFAVDLLLGKK